MLGLIAVVLALLELRKRRRRISEIFLDVGQVGSGVGPNGTAYVVVSITNGGWAQAAILRLGIVGGRLLNVPGREAKMRWHLPPGESMEFNLVADDYDSVWFLFCAFSVEDRNVSRWSWEPFTQSGPLAEAQDAQIARMGNWYFLRRSFRLSKRSQLRAVRGVGPREGSESIALVPTTMSDELDKANARVVQQFFDERGELHAYKMLADPRKGKHKR